MFIELLDLLRCVQPHEESWLVAALDRLDGRVVLAGLLGCHVCGAEYLIRDGIFHAEPRPHDFGSDRIAGATDPDAWRIAALLDLRGTGVAVLAGDVAGAADALLEITQVSVLAVNPRLPIPPQERFGTIVSGLTLPLRTGVATGFVAASADQQLIGEAVRTLRPGGRLLVPAPAALPVGVRELVRDDREWVASKEASESPVHLTRG